MATLVTQCLKDDGSEFDRMLDLIKSIMGRDDDKTFHFHQCGATDFDHINRTYRVDLTKGCGAIWQHRTADFEPDEQRQHLCPGCKTKLVYNAIKDAAGHGAINKAIDIVRAANGEHFDERYKGNGYGIHQAAERALSKIGESAVDGPGAGSEPREVHGERPKRRRLSNRKRGVGRAARVPKS